MCVCARVCVCRVCVCVCTCECASVIPCGCMFANTHRRILSCAARFCLMMPATSLWGFMCSSNKLYSSTTEHKQPHLRSPPSHTCPQHYSATPSHSKQMAHDVLVLVPLLRLLTILLWSALLVKRQPKAVYVGFEEDYTQSP